MPRKVKAPCVKGACYMYGSKVGPGHECKAIIHVDDRHLHGLPRILPTPEEWEMILNRDPDSWGMDRASYG